MSAKKNKERKKGAKEEGGGNLERCQNKGNQGEKTLQRSHLRDLLGASLRAIQTNPLVTEFNKSRTRKKGRHGKDAVALSGFSFNTSCG